MTRALALIFALQLAACAHDKGDLEALKPAAEKFHQRARWKDFRGAAELIVEERQAAFIKARLKHDDDRDLYITNFELEDARVAPDLMSATVISKISWYRMPSNVEKTAVVTSVFVWRHEAWILESQDDGPFEELKPAPEKEKKTAE